MEAGGPVESSRPDATPARDAGSPTEAPGAVVLDTNVVLDWLLFAEPAVAPLAAAVEAGALTWLACAHMRDEFERVTHYPDLGRWQADPAALLARFDRHARLVATPAETPLLRCADPDDQVFLDLSCAHHARWLVTRDRALLALARLAAPLGLTILTPARWAELGAFSRSASSP